MEEFSSSADALTSRLAVVFGDVDPDPLSSSRFRSYRGAARPYVGVQHDAGIGRLDAALRQFDGKGGRVRTVLFLWDIPNVPDRVGFGGELEVRFADQIEDFICGKEVAWIEVDPALPMPDDDLPDWKLTNNVGPILQESILDSPLVVVEDCSILTEDSHHRFERVLLPFDIFFMRHVIVVRLVSINQRSICPLPAASVDHAVSGAVAEVVGWRGDDEIN